MYHESQLCIRFPWNMGLLTLQEVKTIRGGDITKFRGHLQYVTFVIYHFIILYSGTFSADSQSVTGARVECHCGTGDNLKATPELVAWPDSAWLQLCLSPFPQQQSAFAPWYFLEIK